MYCSDDHSPHIDFKAIFIRILQEDSFVQIDKNSHGIAKGHQTDKNNFGKTRNKAGGFTAVWLVVLSRGTFVNWTVIDRERMWIVPAHLM